MAKTGRNDPCPCGSGKKYKKCCLANEKPVLEAAPREAEPFPLFADPSPPEFSARIPYATDEFMSRNPDSPVTKMELLARQAETEADRGRPEKSYELFRQAQALAPSDGEARNVLQDLEDLCLSAPGLEEKAIEVMVELEALNVRMGDRLQAAFAAAGKGDFLQELERPEEALGEYRRALNEYSGSAWLRVRYARFLAARGDREGAREAYEEALAVPDEHEAHREARREMAELGR
jgi:tetratricopeptide (TPR) repeat protein